MPDRKRDVDARRGQRLITLAWSAGLLDANLYAICRRAAKGGRAAAREALLAHAGLPTEVVQALLDLKEGPVENALPSLGIPQSRFLTAKPPPEVSDTPEDADPLGLASADRYRLERLLGQGGMGEVWLGRDLELDRAVAVKFLREDLITQVSVRERFAEEAQLMGQLQHPAIPPIHDSGINPMGRPYFIMRLVDDGKDLHDALALVRPLAERMIEEDAPPPEDDATLEPWTQGHILTRLRRFELIKIVRLVSLCIASAHARGVLHRDLKPANIMIGGGGEALVLDWGLAKVVGQPDWTTDLDIELAPLAHTKRRQLTYGALGTPGFAAPEQVRGDPAGEQADVYSLGAVLYQVLTFELPFGSIFEFGDELDSLQRAGPEPPSRRAPWARIPSSLESICLRAMEWDPKDRQPSALAFAQDLSDYLAGRLEAQRKSKVVTQATTRAEEAMEERRRCLEGLPAQRERLEQASGRLPAWLPLDQRAPLFALEDDVRGSELKVEEKLNESVEALLVALDTDPSDASVGLQLAELAWTEYVKLDEEDEPDPEELVRWRSLVESYGRGFYDARLQGNGTLRVRTTPPGASITLFEVVNEGVRLVPRNPVSLGRAPNRPHELPMGRYLIEVQHPDAEKLRVPALVRRSQHLRFNLDLHARNEAPRGYVHIPGGECVVGGDPMLLAKDKRPRQVITLDDYYMQRNPVTCREYLEFLNSVPAELAEEHQPRAQTGQELWQRDADGRWAFPEEPPSFHKRPWHPDWPVVQVCHENAIAYAAWVSETTGRLHRLPNNDEWEKAARGTDGRYLPWGNHFDATLANVSTRQFPDRCLEVVDSFPEDCSPFGVRSVSGNVMDLVVDPELPTAVRGGSWFASAPYIRCAAIVGLRPGRREPLVGFRMITGIDA